MQIHVLTPFSIRAAAASQAICATVHLHRVGFVWVFLELHHRTGSAHDSHKGDCLRCCTIVFAREVQEWLLPLVQEQE